MFRDCDHLVDDLHVYTIRGNWNNHVDLLLAKPVYERSSVGENYCKIVDVRGETGENLVWLDPRKFDHISCKGIYAGAYNGDRVWDRVVRGLTALGIRQEDIGLFGSKRLGFPNCRDEDFIVYGIENMNKLHMNIDLFKKNAGLVNHTLAHAKYQATTHGRYYDKSRNDLLLCLLNKWSTCAYTDSSTLTIRFVDDNEETGELLRELFYQKDLCPVAKVKGVVSDADGTSFMPRRFSLQAADRKYQVICPLWIFHQCVKENDLVEVAGSVVGDYILVRNYDHGIRFV